MTPKNGYSCDLDQFDKAIDSLDRADLAQTIVDDLRDYRSCPDGRVVGLYGSWGAGKSHVLAQTIKQCLEQNAREEVYIIPCIFKAWRYETEGDLAPGLIRSLLQLPDHENIRGLLQLFDDGEFSKEYRKIAKELLKIILDLSISTIPAGQVVSGALKQMGKQLAESSVDVSTKQPNVDDANIDKVQGKLRQLVNSIITQAERKYTSKKARLVIFIDDLDRCSPKNMVRLFEWLKNHLLVENCVYVLGLDHVAAARAIVGEYKNYLENDKDLAYGLRYLEKLVDSEYELGSSDMLESMAIKDLYSDRVAYAQCRDIKQLVEKIAGEQFAGIAQTETLLELQCLRTPRTMLKVITKFTRVIEAFQKPRWNEERNSFPAYPFWTLFLVSLYYRLEPDEFVRFVAGEFSIFNLMKGEDNPDFRSKKEGQSQTGPLADFENFASRFKSQTGGQVSMPSLKQRRLLAQLIYHN